MIGNYLSIFIIFTLLIISPFVILENAYAAKLVVIGKTDLSDQIQTDSTICGITSNFLIKTIGKSIVKIWDNGHFKGHINLHQVILDTNNHDSILAIGQTTINQQGKFMDNKDISSFQINHNLICKNGNSNTSDHLGITIHRDGSVSAHNEFP